MPIGVPVWVETVKDTPAVCDEMNSPELRCVRAAVAFAAVSVITEVPLIEAFDTTVAVAAAASVKMPPVRRPE